MSVRVPRRELNDAAQRLSLSGASLLRRLIASDLGHARDVASIPNLLAPTSRGRTDHPSRAIGGPQEAPIVIIDQVGRIRAIEEIVTAVIAGRPITGEEQLRLRAAQKFRP